MQRVEDLDEVVERREDLRPEARWKTALLRERAGLLVGHDDVAVGDRQGERVEVEHVVRLQATLRIAIPGRDQRNPRVTRWHRVREPTRDLDVAEDPRPPGSNPPA